MKLLIADDDRTLCHLLAAEMQSRGWTVEIAADAMQVVMFAMRGKPDAILLDLQMPGGTGMHALKKLKASNKTARIPVYVLSGSTDSAAEADVIGLGAVQFIRKPADAEQLAVILAELKPND